MEKLNRSVEFAETLSKVYFWPLDLMRKVSASVHFVDLIDQKCAQCSVSYLTHLNRRLFPILLTHHLQFGGHRSVNKVLLNM